MEIAKAAVELSLGFAENSNGEFHHHLPSFIILTAVVDNGNCHR
jgi:hypothetical protein